jgi:hypothetical protein
MPQHSDGRKRMWPTIVACALACALVSSVLQEQMPTPKAPPGQMPTPKAWPKQMPTPKAAPEEMPVPKHPPKSLAPLGQAAAHATGLPTSPPLQSDKKRRRSRRSMGPCDLILLLIILRRRACLQFCPGADAAFATCQALPVQVEVAGVFIFNS